MSDGGENTRDDGGLIREEPLISAFRLRTARTTAHYALLASPLFVGLSAVKYLDTGDPLHFASFGFWGIADALWLWALVLLRRGEIDRATDRILIGVSIIVSLNSYFEETILALAGYLLGFPILQMCALAIARERHIRLWSWTLPPLFVVVLVTRHAFNPLDSVDAGDSIAVAFGGALGLLILGRLSIGLDGLKRALASSEEIRDVLGEANAELQEARDEALAANHAKSAFLATMSHELRTPLNAIIGYSELIAEEHEALPITEDIDRILDASHHLLELINSVLDLSKIEAGRMDVFYESIAVDALLQSVANTVRPTVERKQSQLILNVEQGLYTLDSDLTKVRQILLNLASNAAKFTEAGSVEIRAAAVPGEDGEDGLEFSVRDTGIGISEEHLEAIFNPFVQADTSTTRRFGGTGLGLAITRRFTEMLGGSIQVTSTVGVGSCFTVWLPRRAPDAGTRPREGSSAWRISQFEADSASMSMSVGPISRAHVLVIDDNTAVHQQLRRLLLQEGFRVSVAASGAEALDLARRDPPDLVTIDLVKQVADSWGTLCALKADDQLNAVPVQTICFGAAGPDAPPSALGVVDFLSLPAPPDRLKELLDRLPTAAEPTAPRELLLILDDAIARTQVRESIDRERWRITEAPAGEGAIADLRAPLPDAILLGLKSPASDAFAILEALAARPDLRAIPVVLLLPRTLTSADLHTLAERARAHLSRGLVDGEAALLGTLRRLREADTISRSGATAIRSER